MIDPTQAILEAANPRRRRQPAVLYGEQAHALRADAQVEVGLLLQRRAQQQGLSQRDLVTGLGYTNINKGFRRVDAVFDGAQPGDLRQRLSELLQVSDEVGQVLAQAENEAQVLEAAALAERDLLRRHLHDLVDHAVEIAADEDLRLALPCENAVASVAYIGHRHLPLGTLLENWSAERRLPVVERFYVVGVGGSPLSGSGSVWGFDEASMGSVSKRFDRRLGLALLEHPLVEPFQRRLSSGNVLRIGEVVEHFQ